MPFPVEQPLTGQELRVVRGMIDEYRYHEQRGRLWRSRWTFGKVVVAVLSGVVVLVVQVVTLIVVLRGGR